MRFLPTTTADAAIQQAFDRLQHLDDGTTAAHREALVWALISPPNAKYSLPKTTLQLIDAAPLLANFDRQTLSENIHLMTGPESMLYLKYVQIANLDLEYWQQIRTQAQSLPLANMPLITGTDIRSELKIIPGPIYRDIFRYVENLFYLGEIQTKSQALRAVRSHFVKN